MLVVFQGMFSMLRIGCNAQRQILNITYHKRTKKIPYCTPMSLFVHKTTKKTSMPLEINNCFIFWSIFNLTAPFEWPKDTYDKFQQMKQHAQLKVLVSEISPPWLLSLMKKSKKLIHSFQRYWWTNIVAIWLSKSIFWLIT